MLLAASAADPFAAGAMAPKDLLRTIAGFTEAEWAAVERGEAVSKLLATDAREVAVVGAVRITGSRNQLVARSRDPQTLKSSMVLDVGRFSTVPEPSDLQRVIFDERSLDLRACQPGDCPVRLSAADVARFHREVNWSAPDWRTQSAAVWRSVLANYASAYLANGRSALPDYVNKRDPLSVASEVAALARDYDFVSGYSPEFHAYMREFGSRIPPAPSRCCTGPGKTSGSVRSCASRTRSFTAPPAGDAGHHHRDQPGLRRSLSRRGAYRHAWPGRRAGLLHDFRQPRPDPLPERSPAPFRAVGRPGPQPRRDALGARRDQDRD